ncbi:hypothetical protein COCNU_scaffold003949G000020 [Cocos nucifera]|nr:hypothetical protein [Cocos nucifera]
MLAKRLYTQKRKEKAPGGSLKRMKVDASSSVAPTVIVVAFEVATSVEVLPTIELDHQMFAHIKRAHHLEAEAEKVQEDLRAKLDHQMFAHIKRAHHLEAEAEKVQEDLRAKVSCLQEKVGEVKRLMEEKMVEIESLQDALRKEEFVSTGLKAALALKKERKKEVEIKVVELEA